MPDELTGMDEIQMKYNDSGEKAAPVTERLEGET